MPEHNLLGIVAPAFSPMALRTSKFATWVLYFDISPASANPLPHILRGHREQDPVLLRRLQRSALSSDQASAADWSFFKKSAIATLMRRVSVLNLLLLLPGETSLRMDQGLRLEEAGASAKVEGYCCTS